MLPSPGSQSGTLIFFSARNNSLTSLNCYFGGYREGIVSTSDQTNFMQINKTVFDTFLAYGISYSRGAVMYTRDGFFTGKVNEFRNLGGGIGIGDGAMFLGASEGGQFYFSGITGPCILMRAGAKFYMGLGDNGCINGSAPNSDVGIQFDRHRAEVQISNWNVSGANGAVRMADGTIYANYSGFTTTPTVDAWQNLIRRGF